MYFDFVDLCLFIYIVELFSLIQGVCCVFFFLVVVSVWVKVFEGQFGSCLLYCDSCGVELILVGQCLLQYVWLIMCQVEYLKSEFIEYGSDVVGYICIFVNIIVVIEFFLEIFVGFFVVCFGVIVDLQECFSCDIVCGVLDGFIDFGIIVGLVVVIGLQVLYFSIDCLVMVVFQGYLLVGQVRVCLCDILQFQYIGLFEGIILYVFLYEWVEQMGEQLLLCIQVFSFEVICWMIEGGVGIGVILQFVVCCYSWMMKLVIIEFDEFWVICECSLLVCDLEVLLSCLWVLIEELQRVGDSLQGG